MTHAAARSCGSKSATSDSPPYVPVSERCRSSASCIFTMLRIACTSGVGQLFVPPAVNDATSTIEGTDVISTSFRPPSDMVAMCELVRLFAVGALSTVLLVG